MNSILDKPGVQTVGGREYMVDGKGSLIPASSVKEHDKVEDEFVRDLVARAEKHAQALRLFKEAGFTEVDAFNELLDERYAVKKKGLKGNQTFKTFDGLMEVQVAIADQIEFGAGLQQAKALIDEYLQDLTKDSGDELVTLVTKAFDVGKEGIVNAKALLALKTYNFKDDRWIRAMAAIDDSIRITGSKRYIRFSKRDRPDGKWQMIPLNIAVA
jgi:LPS O-antigen subunit length determinant protein (WzzB/FepE family)